MKVGSRKEEIDLAQDTSCQPAVAMAGGAWRSIHRVKGQGFFFFWGDRRTEARHTAWVLGLCPSHRWPVIVAAWMSMCVCEREWYERALPILYGIFSLCAWKCYRILWQYALTGSCYIIISLFVQCPFRCDVIYINQFGVVQLFVIFFYFPSHNFPVPTLIICVFALFSDSCLPVCLSVCLCAGISLFLSVHKSGCLLCPETLRLMQRWKWFIVLSFQCVLWWFPVYFCQHENILHSCLGYFNENNHQVYPWI